MLLRLVLLLASSQIEDEKIYKRMVNGYAIQHVEADGLFIGDQILLFHGNLNLAHLETSPNASLYSQLICSIALYPTPKSSTALCLIHNTPTFWFAKATNYAKSPDQPHITSSPSA